MKKWLAVLAALTMLLGMTACGTAPEKEEDSGLWDWESEPSAEPTGVTLNVYNWGEYIDDEDLQVNKAFEHITGIKVNYQTFDSNETMYTLLKAGAADYDVVCPSDYMIGKMIQEGMLAKLNFDNIPNYQYIDEQYRGLSYDPKNEYSVPYTWGTVGIFYNKKYVDEADLAQGWDILWNEKYADKIYMFDNQRDAFGIALKKLGYSMNTTKEEEWQAAYEELAKQKPLLQGYFMDQVFDKMIAEEGWLTPYYAGDGSIMIYGDDGNEDIGYFVPEQGTNLFVDAWCVLENSPHKAEAEAYINFLCRTEVAKANAEYLGYSTPHTEARKQLDPEVADNPVFYPEQDVLDNTEVFVTLPQETNRLMDSLWIQLKK
ncbi:MAG: ABC transporter substrate-binding protein [Acutalibacteraceae bacterium]|jgi:spermidine/putrescine transport system substrate-binding protein